MLGIISYATAAPFDSRKSAAKIDMEDPMPLQTDEGTFKNPVFIESLTGHPQDTAEANKGFTQLHTKYVYKPEFMEKSAIRSEATDIHQIMNNGETSGLNSVTNSNEIGDGNEDTRKMKNIDVIETTECEEEDDQLTGACEIDVCHPCRGCKPAEDLSMTGGMRYAKRSLMS